MRRVGLAIWLGALLLGIILLFWRVEWVYSLPTAVPKNYHHVPAGQRIDIASRIKLHDGRPQVLHFFNPDCPCSKFNVTHFRSLVKLYAGRVDFIIVPMTDKKHTVKEIQDLFQLNLPVLFDTTLAAICGVYSTPQAVIIDANQTLYYRGNYNRSRYCTDKKSNYAMMALDSLLLRKANPVFNQYALQAYGCKIPGQ